ncbi:MAG: hypothetical protein ACOC38_02760 [Promethearchaeia archaeon]
MQFSYSFLVGLALYGMSMLVFLYVVVQGSKTIWKTRANVQGEITGIASFYVAAASRMSTHVLFWLGLFLVPLVLFLIPNILMNPSFVGSFLFSHWWVFAILAMSYLLIPFMLSKTDTEIDEEERIYWEKREQS